MNDTTLDLLTRYRGGEDRAAEALFVRYMERLTRLARSRLSRRLTRRIDAEDIVLSAWRSFFVRARDGRFLLERNGDLWRLLATMTLRKLYRQARRHSAEARDIARELGPGQTQAAELANHEPTPDEAAGLADEVFEFMGTLPEAGRRVLELRLQGALLQEIADDVGRSERTVRRWLDEMETDLRRRLAGVDDA